MNLPKLPRKTNAMYSAFGGHLNYCRRANDEHRKRGGRLSFYYGRDLDREVTGSISLEYYCQRPVYVFGGHVHLGHDDDYVSGAAYLWPFSLYVNTRTPLGKKLNNRLISPKWDGERQIGIHVSSRGDRFRISWDPWHPSMSWESGTPRWRSGSWDVVDSLLGRRDMRWETVETVEGAIPMPEGSYPATIEMRDHVSWRRRLPFIKRRQRCANVDVPGGIGFPGKGESAWDCGDDAIFAMSCAATSSEEAIGKVVASVLDKRKRYGGSYEFVKREASHA